MPYLCFVLLAAFAWGLPFFLGSWGWQLLSGSGGLGAFMLLEHVLLCCFSDLFWIGSWLFFFRFSWFSPLVLLCSFRAWGGWLSLAEGSSRGEGAEVPFLILCLQFIFCVFGTGSVDLLYRSRLSTERNVAGRLDAVPKPVSWLRV